MSTTIEPLRIARPGAAFRAGAVYVLMLVAAIGVFLAIRSAGSLLELPETAGTLSKSPVVDPLHGVMAHVIGALAAIIGLGFLLGRLSRRLGQPAVIGEIVAGILLGPSVLGAISPAAMHALVPDSIADPNRLVLTSLTAIANLGIILYLFLVGLTLNGAKLKAQARSAVAISHASIVAPFVLGAAISLWLFPNLAPEGTSFTSFALFTGAALSITAFPVLARILGDRGLEKTDLGITALGCAAADDVTAWCLLAFVVGVAQAQMGVAAIVVGESLLFIAGMYFLVRPLARRVCLWLDERAEMPTAAVPIAFVILLLASLIAESIGIHAVFGAFLLGAVIPSESKLAREMTRTMKDVVVVFLLPAFFALTGLRTEIGLVAGWQAWLACGAIIVVATLGKFGGAFVAARFTGHGWRHAAALGAMMNTRGLMGLVVLDYGLGMGVISPTLYAMMVIMALATTMATTPLLQVLIPERTALDIEPGADRPLAPLQPARFSHSASSLNLDQPSRTVL